MMTIPSQSFSGYAKLLGAAWRQLWRRPLVFLPLFYAIVGFSVIIGAVFGLVYAAYGGLEGVSSATTTGLLSLGLLLVILMFLFGVHVFSLSLVVLSRVAADKPLLVGESFRLSSRLYTRALRAVLALLVALLPLFVIIGVMIGCYVILVFGSIDASVAVQGVLGLVLLLLLFIMIPLSLLYQAWLLFVRPMIVYTSLDAWELIRESWRLLWKDASHTWLVFLIQLGVAGGASLVMNVVGLIVYGSEPPFLFSVISFVIMIIIGLWCSLFVFGAFFRRYKPKVL